MTNTLTWNIKPIQLRKNKSPLLSMISLLVLASLMFGMFGTIQPALADDCLIEHLAVIVARATLDLAKANKDAAQAAIGNAETLAEYVAAGIWLAAAEIALNLAEAAHDDAVEDLNECLNPPCPCGCEVEGCDTCGEHASTCSGGNSGSSSGYYE